MRRFAEGANDDIDKLDNRAQMRQKTPRGKMLNPLVHISYLLLDPFLKTTPCMYRTVGFLRTTVFGLRCFSLTATAYLKTDTQKTAEKPLSVKLRLTG